MEFNVQLQLAGLLEWMAWQMTACHGKTAVIGISGGKDSSTVAALAVAAYGRENVMGVLMPDGVQPDIDYSQALVETLQSADAIEADIDNDVNYFLVVLGGKTIGYFAWKMENTALHLMHLYLKPEYRGKALGRDIVLSCERLARGEGKGRVWCTVHAKALPVQQFFKALRYRNLKPAEQDTGTVPRDEVVFEHTLG